MVRNLLSVRDEFQVNLLDPIPRGPPHTQNGLLGSQIFPQVTLLENGNFVVVYQNNAGGDGDDDILSIEFTPGGEAVGTPFRVDFDSGDQVRPDVAPRQGGGFAAVWLDEDLSDSIRMAVVTAASPSNPSKFTVANEADRLEGPSIATFANGTYIVTYTRKMASSDDVWFGIVNKGGTTHVKANTGLVTSIDTDENAAKVATSGDLAAVVFVKGSFSADIELAILNSAGNGVDFKTVADIAGDTDLPDVAALSDGRFVIVWQELASTVDVRGRIYDPVTKEFSGAAFTIAGSSVGEGIPSVAGLPDGGFIVTWTEQVGPEPNPEITVHARRFDSNGAPAGDAFKLSDASNQVFSSAASDKSGNVFTAWFNAAPNSHTTDPDAGVQGHVFRTAVETVNGTNGNDTITTYSLSEPINGLGGKDKIDARAGNDVVSGGEGKDTLTGGLGIDAFLFDVKLKGKNADHITDFLPGTDKLELDHDIFKKLKVGELKNSAFFAGNKVEDGKDDKDHIVYDKKSGKLLYDADGPGGADAHLVAILDGSPNKLSHKDFEIVI